MRRKNEDRPVLLGLLLMLSAVAAYAQWSSADLLDDPDDGRPVTLAWVDSKARASAGAEAHATAALAGAADEVRGARATIAAGSKAGLAVKSGGEGAEVEAAVETAVRIDAEDPLRVWPGSRTARAEGAVALRGTIEPQPLPPGTETTRPSLRLIERADQAIERIVNRVNDRAERIGNAVMAGRLAPEFGVESEVLLEQSLRAGSSMGDVVVAHTIAGQEAKTSLTAEALLARRARSASWASVAADAGVDLDLVVRASREESKVALGSARADGRVSTGGGASLAAAPSLASAAIAGSGGAGGSASLVSSGGGITGGAVAGAGAGVTGGVTALLGGNLLPRR